MAHTSNLLPNWELYHQFNKLTVLVCNFLGNRALKFAFIFPEQFNNHLI